jgi:toxin ParE1/3/4
MGGNVAVLPRADRDLDDQFHYYMGKRTPETAVRWLDRAHATFRFLLTQPGLGAPCQAQNPELAGLRRWPIDGFGNHYVYYRPTDDGIEVVRVLGGFRDVRSLF